MTSTNSNRLSPITGDEISRNHPARGRILAILRLAFRVLGMRRRALGRLGGGAAVAALLVSFGGVTPASAQFVAGGGTAPGNALNQNVLNRLTGVGNLNYPNSGSANSTPQGVAIGTSTAFGGGDAIGFNNIAGVSGSFAGFAFGNENLATGGWAVGIGNGNTSTGTAATAIGVANVASGNTAIAFGRQSTASGNFAIAQGNVATASAINAVALGNSTQATGVGSIVIGSGTTTTSSNFDATASKATANNAIAIGVTTVASAADSTAVGELSSVSAQFGSAFGFKATATGTGATAIGGNATAGASAAAANAVAIGGQSSVAAAATSGIAIGKGATSSVGVNATAFGVFAQATNTDALALGSGGTTAATATMASGVGAVAIGGNATSGARALGANAIAVGGQSTANAAAAIAIGNLSVATGANAIAEGLGATASATNATAVGHSAAASVAGAIALGGNATAGANASAADSVAIGGQSAASNTEAVAIGRLAAASGVDSIAIGQTAKASGTQSIAIGFQNTVTGSNSGAFGDPNTISGAGSYAVGNNNTIAAAKAFVLGNNVTVAAALNGAVALGDSSTVAAAVGTTTAIVGTTTFAGFAGTTPTATVSIGGSGTERTLTNVAAGRITATSTDAINGSQLFSVATVVDANKTNINGLGTTTAAALGGGSTYTAGTGVSAPSYGVYGSAQTSVGAAIAALQTGGPVQYTAGVGGATTTTPGTTEALVGAGGSTIGGVTLQNVAPGSLASGSTQAIDGGQLNTGLASVATALGGGSTFNPATGGVSTPTYTVNGASQTGVGNAIGALNTLASQGWSVTTAATGTGTATGSGTQIIAPGATATVTAGNNIAITQAGATITIATSMTPTFSSVGVSGGPTLSATGIDMGGRKIANLAPGTAGTDAVDLNQLNAATGSTKYFAANSTLPGALASGTDSVAIGPNANAGNANDVALGAGSTTAAPHTGITDLTGSAAAAVQTATAGVVSVGSAGNERQLQNVAAGVLSATSTDAVNGSQLFSVGTGVNTLGTTVATALGDGATYTPGTGVTGFGSTVAGGTQTTVGAALTALDTAARKQGTGLAAALGGTTAVAADGTVTAPSFAVGSSTYSNVNAALNALQTGAPVQYSTAGATTTPNGLVPSQNLTLVGTAVGPVTLSNVAAGTLATASTDAVNGSQLYATNQNVTALTNGTAGLVQQTGGAPGSGTLTVGAATGGTTIDFTGTSGPRALSGVAPGSTATGSTQAVNGGQLNTSLASVATNLGGGSTYDPTTGKVTAPSYAIGTTTYADVGSALGALNNSVNNGAGIKYFHANSTLADSSATGTDATAIGPLASATAAGSIALGASSVANRGAITAITDPLSLTGGTVTTTTGELSIGTTTAARQITNVAAGTQATDAVNVGQITPLIAAQAQLGTTAAAALGGTATYDPTTGKISAPAFTVGTTTYHDVGSALAGLQSGAPVQYATAGAPTTANGLVPSQNLTLVGVAPGAVTLDNVAAGIIATGSTQAIDGGQIFANQASVAAALGGGSVVNPNGTISAPAYSVGGTTYNTVGGTVAALDTGLTGVKTQLAALPLTANNTASLAAPTATGANATAVGYGATASGANSVALGSGSTDSGQANVVSVGAVGAERKIVNVAVGTVSATSTDAINGQQLYGTAKSVAAALGGGAVVNPDGTVSAPSYAVGGTAYTNVGGAVTALDTGLTGVKSALASLPLTANNTANLAVPSATGTNATAVGFGANSTGTNSVALGSGSTDGGQANVVSIGAAGAERKLVNVAAGALSATSTDAVNGQQLDATNAQVAALGHSAVQYATTPTGSTTSVITLSSDAGGPVIIHNLAPGVAASDAANVGQVQAVAAVANNGVQYDKNLDGSRANTVTFAGGTAGAPVALQNIAAGVNATDAVNLGQLQAAGAGTLKASNAYTDQRVSNLAALTNQGLSDTQTLAKNGTALALAGTGLRYDDRPGKTSVTGATAYYKGTMGMAFGLGHTSSDQAWRYNVSINGTPWADKPEIGVVAGASYTFN